jgi:hypothetical protein
MRTVSYVAALLLICGCGSSGAGEMLTDDGSGAKGPDSGEGGNDGDGTGDPNWNGELAAPAQIAAGEATLLGVTGDGWAIFRAMEMLIAAPVAGDEAVKDVSTTPGNVVMRGNVLFNWANVDWEKGVGDLSVWSAEGGSHELGETPYVESWVAASESGSAVVYPANTTETTTDIMISSNDFAEPVVLLPAVGIGTEETCGAQIGFVGERLFVGWCQEGSRAAVIQRFDLVDGEWQSETIAEDALPNWSASASGERVFYQSSQYSGYVAEGGNATLIDASVGRGQITPDGATVLYTVGDQLRRAEVDAVNPVPIVTTGYKQPVGFSSSFDLALYSTTVSYEQGTKQDLLLVSTEGLNTEPIQLVSSPVAALARSNMTADGRFVFYLTDMSANGATLHVVAKDGSEMLSLPGVVEVAAANDSTLVFSDNMSDPNAYPITADLKVLNLAQETTPRVVEEKVLDGRSFYLSPDRKLVTYVRSGVDLDPMAADSKGIFVREIK